jgi:hypothetical protein
MTRRFTIARMPEFRPSVRRVRGALPGFPRRRGSARSSLSLVLDRFMVDQWTRARGPEAGGRGKAPAFLPLRAR